MKSRLIAHLGWPIVILLTVFPILLWSSIGPISDRFASSYVALGIIGKLSGIIALVLFCINIMLTKRLKLVENIFGGLNKMYIAHHFSGGIALCVILIHPIALSLQKTVYSFNDAALLLLPRPSDIPVGLGIIALWLFIGLMFITFYMSLPW